MSGETVVTIIGNLTSAPELRFTPSGAAVANFTVASTPRTFDRQANDWRDGDPLFMRCSVWRQPAENVAETLHKGTRVIVTGRLTTRTWEQDGQRRSAMELEVDEIGPSLRYATAKVTKTERNGGGQGFDAQSNPGGGWGQPQQASGWGGMPASAVPEPPFVAPPVVISGTGREVWA